MTPRARQTTTDEKSEDARKDGACLRHVTQRVLKWFMQRVCSAYTLSCEEDMMRIVSKEARTSADSCYAAKHTQQLKTAAVMFTSPTRRRGARGERTIREFLPQARQRSKTSAHVTPDEAARTPCLLSCRSPLFKMRRARRARRHVVRRYARHVARYAATTVDDSATMSPVSTMRFARTRPPARWQEARYCRCV